MGAITVEIIVSGVSNEIQTLNGIKWSCCSMKLYCLLVGLFYCRLYCSIIPNSSYSQSRGLRVLQWIKSNYSLIFTVQLITTSWRNMKYQRHALLNQNYNFNKHLFPELNQWWKRTVKAWLRVMVQSPSNIHINTNSKNPLSCLFIILKFGLFKEIPAHFYMVVFFNFNQYFIVFAHWNCFLQVLHCLDCVHV